MRTEDLEALLTIRMPFGKYKNYRIADLPVRYLEWFEQKGFPKGQLGELMALAHEIQLNGLIELLEPIRQSLHE